MKKETKIKIYAGLLVVCLIIFNLQLFVFEAPNGVPGFIFCVICFYGIIGSICKLCKLSTRFKNSFLASIDLLFWLP